MIGTKFFVAGLLAAALAVPCAYAQEQSADKNAKQGSQADANTTGNRETGKAADYSGWREKWANVDAIGERNPCAGLNFYSLEKQIAIGKQVAQQVERSSRLVDDPVVVDYVNRVGQNLVRNSDAKVPFTFKVIDSDVVNAFSLPGGFTFVNSGLILRASNEAELAGVIGHEISHVIACHGAKQETKAQIAQMAMIPVAIMLPYGWAGYGIYEGLNLAVPLAFLRFSREDEAQADFLGLEYMYKAGYDPNAFVSFFEKIEAEDKRHPGTIPKIFATHPPTPARVEAAQKEIATILPARPEYIVTTSDFDRVKARLQAYEAGRKVQEKQSNRPTLRKKTEQTAGQQGGGQGSGDDNHPVLKRRP
jgi:predicted Zn-dependent protease